MVNRIGMLAPPLPCSAAFQVWRGLRLSLWPQRFDLSRARDYAPAARLLSFASVVPEDPTKRGLIFEFEASKVGSNFFSFFVGVGCGLWWRGVALLAFL